MNSIWNRLSSLPVGTRISLGFTIVLLLHVSLAVKAHLGMARAEAELQTYDRIQNHVAEIGDIDRMVGELERNVLLFTRTGHDAPKKRVLATYVLLDRAIELARAHAADTKKATFERMSTHLEVHEELFDAVVTDRSRRQVIIEQDVVSVVDEVIDSIHTLENAQPHLRPETQGIIAQIRQAETDVNHFVHQPDSRLIQESTALLKECQQSLGRMPFPVSSSQSSVDIERAIDAVEKYQRLVHEMVQTTCGYMHLVNVVMAGEAVELVRLSDEYLHESNRELDLLTTSMMTGFRNYRTVNNLFSVFTVLLGIAASFLITRSIVQPLRHITDALSGLTKGDYTGAIQGADRGDEFGRLAAAAKVFREKSDKVEELLADSRKTERRMSSYAAELETRNRELDEFTNLASHDLQEPLRKLITFSKLLPSDIGGDLPERAKSDIEFIADAAERMRNLVRDLLELARTGTKEISIETVDVGQCVDEALRAVTGRIEETGAVIEKDELPVIRGNARLISQLFQNLISNALKFIDSNRVPKIRVTAEWKDSKWVLGVSDNGIGIPDNGKTRIFEAFRRLHGKGTYAGTGIGLAICRKAVDRHNGAIWVESEVGKGSHFQFFLKPEEESWITEKAPAEPLCSSSKTILAIRN